ncbi:MAG: anti-sigma factor domain-containing protein [Terriglobia bacterium]
MNAHPQYDEDFELYELGVLDGPDKAGFAAHLQGCAECRAKIEVARRHVAMFALASPQTEPPPALRESILALFRAGRREGVKGAPSVPARRGLWTPAWARVLAVVCVLLVGTAVWLTMTNQRLSRRLAEIELIHQRLETSNLELKASTAHAQAVSDMLTSPQSLQVELSPAASRLAPHGKAFYNRDKGLLFYTTNLPSLPSGRTYEFWLIPTVGKPVDVGVFNTDSQGNGQLILTSLPNDLTAKAFAVTIEPAGGVSAPTGYTVLVGPVS